MVSYLFSTLLFLNIIGSGIYLLSKMVFMLAGDRVTEHARYLGCIMALLLFLIPFYQLLPNLSAPGDTEVGIIEYPSTQTAMPENVEYAENTRESVSRIMPSYEMQRNLLAIWSVGMAAVLLWHLLTFLHFRKNLAQRYASSISEELQKTANLCAAECNIRQCPVLRALPDIHGPMLIGFFRPIIVIPADGLSLEEAPLILKHELVHFKRHDLWWKLLGVFLQAVHWFNPFVRMLCKELEFYTETSCDAQVVRNLNHSQRKQYGYLLISYVQTQRRTNSLPSLSFPPEHKQLKRRIFVMIHGNKSKKLIATAIVGILTVSSFALSAFAAEHQSTRVNRIPYMASLSDTGSTEKQEQELPSSDERWMEEYGAYGYGRCHREDGAFRNNRRNCHRQGYSNAQGQEFGNRGYWS